VFAADAKITTKAANQLSTLLEKVEFAFLMRLIKTLDEKNTVFECIALL